MAGNSFGRIFRLTTFGESHGAAIGGVLDGCPAGLEIDLEAIAMEMARRRPGQSAITTQRDEADQVELLSGVFEGRSTGAPIGFIIRNKDHKSRDYDTLKDVFRPSHADFVFEKKYGFRDHRGGGRSSARETASRVVAGAIAKQFLKKFGIELTGFVSAIYDVRIETPVEDIDLSKPENELRCPDEAAAARMRERIEEAMAAGDTLGGVVTCIIKGAPVGLGEPVFDKLHADLGKAMLSINAVKGFEIGSGFAAAGMKGSAHNDAFRQTDGATRTITNHSGGIQGGITNGMDIITRVAFKPVASIRQKQETIDKAGERTSLEITGRHDPCVVPRAVPIVEAMAALVFADHLLRQRTDKIEL